MIRRIGFFVPGTPRSAGSKIPMRSKHGKMYVMDSTGAKTKHWRASVVFFAHEAMKEADLKRFDGPVRVDADFILDRPNIHYDSKKRLRPQAPFWHSKIPDIDKLARAVSDALMDAGVFKDDAQIADMRVTKRYLNSNDISHGVWIKVYSISQSNRLLVDELKEEDSESRRSENRSRFS